MEAWRKLLIIRTCLLSTYPWPNSSYGHATQHIFTCTIMRYQAIEKTLCLAFAYTVKCRWSQVSSFSYNVQSDHLSLPILRHLRSYRRTNSVLLTKSTLILCSARLAHRILGHSKHRMVSMPKYHKRSQANMSTRCTFPFPPKLSICTRLP